MTFNKFYFTYIILFIIVSCSSEPDQNPIISVTNGTISGFVQEANTNTPIYYAKITTSPSSKEILTSIDGSFTLADIPTGDYVVYAYQEGYDNDSAFVSVTDKDTATTNLSLVNFSEYLDYYPLDIGNYWEYWSSGKPIYSLKVISDTIISQKEYKIIELRSLISQNIEYRYERVDIFNALVYRYFPYENKEMLIDSMAAKVGQKFTSNMFYLPYKTCNSICYSINEEEIFDTLRDVRRLKQACGTDLPDYTIAHGIGLYYYSIWRMGIYRLKYARIRGVEFGKK